MAGETNPAVWIEHIHSSRTSLFLLLRNRDGALVAPEWYPDLYVPGYLFFDPPEIFVLDRLTQVDRALFEIINGRWQNPVFDAIMPVLSDDGKFKVIFLLVFVGLMVFGKAKGRWAAAMVIPLLALSDQTSSNLLKHAFERVRPCHVLANVHLLAGCSGSWSMPSSHAANSAAAAVHFLLFYPRWRLPLAILAFGVGYSRVYVGVHYPADVLVGFAVGIACAFAIQGLYRWLRRAWATRRALRAAA